MRKACLELLPVCKLKAGNTPHPGHRSLWEGGPEDELPLLRAKVPVRSCQEQRNGEAS